LVAVAPDLKWQTLLLFPALARFGQVLTLTGARHARQDGLGAAFAVGSGKVSLIVAFISVAIAGYYLLDIRGIAALAAVCVLTAAGRMFFQRKLGGLTGDTIGCISELNEILVLVVISATI
jgi:adenosylcobinamide-GDP ribazoletransferase